MTAQPNTEAVKQRTERRGGARKGAGRKNTSGKTKTRTVRIPVRYNKLIEKHRGKQAFNAWVLEAALQKLGIA